ncbi:polysaccharide export protein [Flavobacterium bomense]|uniref:Polysaccharide export protein n=1 Tax=Flavobacterium bomense TaxID=2497483 RepID=A0A3S0PFU7_9FLAO|nr:polysaccharide biosynthesis/export family protein [Flavobacterium bomense]RTZ02063.1 polysaccharide export protein [Flavobacterium bomense]
MIKSISTAILFAVLFQSCASKKDILYFQDATNYPSIPVEYDGAIIQTNDILSITVSALVPDTAIPYNVQTAGNGQAIANIEILKLQGYLVSPQGAIVFPVLGTIPVVKQSILQLEEHIRRLLAEGGHLVNPTVSIRILNAKVTVLGEVKEPGTYTYAEQYLTLPQALGYAGDLTINGKRTDILLIREIDGVRTINKIDLTTAKWMTDPKYIIRQNDVLVVNPNNPKVKSAGYVGNAGTLLTIASLLLSSIILLTR